MKKQDIDEQEADLKRDLFVRIRDFQLKTGCEVRSITLTNDAVRFGPPELKGVEVEIIVDASDTE